MATATQNAIDLRLQVLLIIISSRTVNKFCGRVAVEYPRPTETPSQLKYLVSRDVKIKHYRTDKAALVLLFYTNPHCYVNKKSLGPRT